MRRFIAHSKTPLAYARSYIHVPEHNSTASRILEQLAARDGLMLGQSSTTEAKDSYFEAYAAVGDVSRADVDLMCNLARELASADVTHGAMMGYVLSDGTSGHNDDGERGAGRRIVDSLHYARSHVFSDPGAGAVVVVTRYFGGTMLGKKRWVMIRESGDSALRDALGSSS